MTNNNEVRCAACGRIVPPFSLFPDELCITCYEQAIEARNEDKTEEELLAECVAAWRDSVAL